jgi:hypothetical protein
MKLVSACIIALSSTLGLASSSSAATFPLPHIRSAHHATITDCCEIENLTRFGGSHLSGVCTVEYAWGHYGWKFSGAVIAETRTSVTATVPGHIGILHVRVANCQFAGMNWGWSKTFTFDNRYHAFGGCLAAAACGPPVPGTAGRSLIEERHLR